MKTGLKAAYDERLAREGLTATEGEIYTALHIVSALYQLRELIGNHIGSELNEVIKKCERPELIYVLSER